MPRNEGKFRVESDTSQKAAGAALFQEQNDEFVLIGYHSKRLPKEVVNYGITELELTGMLTNIHGFKQLLKDRHFEVIVDHKAIENIIKAHTKPTTARMTRLLLKLTPYSFDVFYRQGKTMCISDALSRLRKKGQFLM